MSALDTYKQMIRWGRDSNASDLHLNAGSRPVARISGDIHFYEDVAPFTSDDTKTIAKHLLSENEYQILRREQEVDATKIEDLDGDRERLRVHVYTDDNGLSLAIRRISKELPSYEDLNLPPVLKELANRSHGLLLITGPTGAGKTTTRNALIQYLNETKKKHIITLEDTIEYKLQSQQSLINQLAVGPGKHAPNFAQALSSAMREDPDVISVGDLRSYESMEVALQAAQSGHLVIAELHASTTQQALTRILSFFSSSREYVQKDLAEQLIGAVCQRVIPRHGDDGSILASEVLINSNAVQNLIRDNRLEGLTDIIRSNREVGMHTLHDHILHLADAGVISMQAAQSHLSSLSE